MALISKAVGKSFNQMFMGKIQEYVNWNHICLWLWKLEWVAIPFSSGSSWHNDWPSPPAPQADLPSELSGELFIPYVYLVLGKSFVSFSSVLKGVWDFLKSKILYWMALPMLYFLWENSGSNRSGDPPKGQNWD